MNKTVDVTFTREFINEFGKQVEKATDKMGYKGCSNCRYPMFGCPHKQDGVLHIICPDWVKKDERSDVVIRTAIRKAYLSGYADAKNDKAIDSENTVEKLISDIPFM